MNRKDFRARARPKSSRHLKAIQCSFQRSCRPQSIRYPVCAVAISRRLAHPPIRDCFPPLPSATFIRSHKETVMARANKPPSKPPDPVAFNPAVQSTVEREIKLAIDPNFPLPPLGGIPLPRRLLTSTYYDTSQYDLAHAGITLRHRVERGKQAWELKLALMKDRQEIELVDRQSVPPTMFRDLLFLHLGQRQLIPVATLRVWRAGVHGLI